MIRYAVVGERLGHSISPEIHQAIYDLYGLNCRYEKREIAREESANIVQIMQSYGGYNVTIPYKEVILPQLQSVTPCAAKTRAVNTVTNTNEGAVGDNTDVFGFAYLLQSHAVSASGATCVILGTGGAAKAVYQALSEMGAGKIISVTRQRSPLQAEDCCIEYAQLPAVRGQILINTTPVGMFPDIHSSPVDADVICNFDTLVDVIYNPCPTKFLQIGQRLGKQTLSGLTMLVAQAVQAEQRWQKGVDTAAIEPVERQIRAKFLRKESV